MDKKRNHPTKAAPVSFYLGKKEARDKRIKSLEAIARQFGTTRSALIQKIADGEYGVYEKQHPAIAGARPLEELFNFARRAKFGSDDLREIAEALQDLELVDESEW